jgi:hypothetical protein
MRRTIPCIVLLLGLLPVSGLLYTFALAQTPIPTSRYVATPEFADVWAVGQGIVLWAQVSEATFNTQTAAVLTPTGTMQFYANGQPLGTPATIVEVVDGLARATATVPIQAAGTYTITASYSGDATFAPVTGTLGAPYSLPITVATNPSTLLPVATPSSLTFSAGATTGNSIVIDMTDVNNCECSAEWNTTIAPVPGTPTPANPATLTFSNAPGDSGADGNGGNFSTFKVISTAPHTVTVGEMGLPDNRALRTSSIAAAALLFLLPFSKRRLPRALLLTVTSLFLLPMLIGCSQPHSPGATVTSTTTTETFPGSAGQYYITVQGNTFSSPGNNGGGTYFSVQIPVTIQ